MPKVLYVATVTRKHIMEFHVPSLKMLKDMGWETAVAARNDYDNPSECSIPACDTYFDVPFERNPFNPGNIKAYRQLKSIIDAGDYDVVHVHTPVGAMIGRLAARKARNRGTKVFYTAHGFHFFKGAPLINWLLYYPAERLLAHLTDVLITINCEDYERASKSFKAGEVVYVPGVGIDVEHFQKSPQTREKKRAELHTASDDLVLLSVGELISRKNHEVVVRALGALRRQKKLGHITYVICGDGVLLKKLREIAEEEGVGDCVLLLGYRNDVAEIMAVSDIFVFPSKQEGLPVALMEAMAAGLPVICGSIRGNIDLVENKVNGLLLKKLNEMSVAQAISTLVQEASLREKLGKAASSSIKKFDVSIVQRALVRIYHRVEQGC